ncbi:hypothetical protein SFC88_09480 [Nocardioides sp. HM23]|uniref:hypothetical protein n=1 Tax=Nocardioides bizhenqiangii TaxID=3095076 RepID=UPI002AC9F791|nr:hypothetical protein [Nocardioides sp. HM23]MDZ5621057.1 hypothetical protein [Nocardioides sp. HM23]
MPRKTCAECGGPIKQPKGRGRPRVYCGQLCRNAAYEKRRGAKSRSAAAPDRKQIDEGRLTVGDVLQMRQLQAAREERLLWIDAILDSPTSTTDLMQELICRIALGLVLEDMRYQPAVNQLVVAYRMIGRITNGNFRLPAVNA